MGNVLAVVAGWATVLCVMDNALAAKTAFQPEYLTCDLRHGLSTHGVDYVRETVAV